MNWKISFAGFLCIVAGACIIPFATIDEKTDTIPDKPKQETVVVVSTNSVPFTNSTDRAGTSNLDWFKNSSNYIWDGWKIK